MSLVIYNTGHISLFNQASFKKFLKKMLFFCIKLTFVLFHDELKFL